MAMGFLVHASHIPTDGSAKTEYAHEGHRHNVGSGMHALVGAGCPSPLHLPPHTGNCRRQNAPQQRTCRRGGKRRHQYTATKKNTGDGGRRGTFWREDRFERRMQPALAKARDRSSSMVLAPGLLTVSKEHSKQSTCTSKQHKHASKCQHVRLRPCGRGVVCGCLCCIVHLTRTSAAHCSRCPCTRTPQRPCAWGT